MLSAASCRVEPRPAEACAAGGSACLARRRLDRLPGPPGEARALQQRRALLVAHRAEDRQDARGRSLRPATIYTRPPITPPARPDYGPCVCRHRSPVPQAPRHPVTLLRPPERRSATITVSGASLGSSSVKMPWRSPSWLGLPTQATRQRHWPARETLAVSGREQECGRHTLPQVSRSTARGPWRLAPSALRNLLSAVISVLSSRSASAR